MILITAPYTKEVHVNEGEPKANDFTLLMNIYATNFERH